jgi:hypothetical protein
MGIVGTSRPATVLFNADQVDSEGQHESPIVAVCQFAYHRKATREERDPLGTAPDTIWYRKRSAHVPGKQRLVAASTREVLAARTAAVPNESFMVSRSVERNA